MTVFAEMPERLQVIFPPPRVPPSEMAETNAGNAVGEHGTSGSGFYRSRVRG